MQATPAAVGAARSVVPFYLRAIVILVAVSMMLRLTVNNVAPIIGVIADDLGLSKTEAGLVGSLPLIVFGVFAFATPTLLRRWGSPKTIAILLVIVAVGTAVRFVPTTAALMGGTILLSIGVGMGNAVVPVAIRTFYPRRATAYMGWFSVGLNLGAALGAASTVPLMQKMGLSWNVAISVWFVVILLVLAWWLLGWGLAKRRNSPMLDPQESDSVAGLGAMFRERRLLAIAAHMGIQSAMFFAIMTWGPTWFQAAGVSPIQSGVVLSVFSLACIPGALLGPKLLELTHWRRILIGYAIIYLPAVAVMGSFGFGNSMLGWAATLVAGVCQGAHLAMSLALIAGYPDATKVAGLSALANGVGFLLASIWPVGLGALAQSTGSWSIPIISVVFMPLVTLAITFAINQQFQSEREGLARSLPHL
ncbi:MAG: MFS transporter [Propionibacteriaceae bacterium]|nr:MFS transporter [Propionibacteriaceae bacterium]